MHIDYQTINQFLKENPSDNSCRHTASNINQKELELIGDLNDDSFGFLSYLTLHSAAKNEIFVGAYPLQDCKIYQCEKCKQVIFFRFNDGGIAPRPEYILADYTKSYLAEPAVKSVRLSENRYDELIECFQLTAQDKVKGMENLLHVTINDKNSIYLFNYDVYQSKNGLTARFDLVGRRAFLKEVNNWLTK